MRNDGSGQRNADGGGRSTDRSAERPGPEKDPEDWVTGGEPMTGAQESYLKTLGRQTDEHVPDD